VSAGERAVPSAIHAAPSVPDSTAEAFSPIFLSVKSGLCGRGVTPILTVPSLLTGSAILARSPIPSGTTVLHARASSDADHGDGETPRGAASKTTRQPPSSGPESVP
jgi:hypothetical protein